MNNIRNTIMIFVGALLLAIPAGAIIMKGGIKTSDMAMNPLVQNASAMKAPESKPTTETPKPEPTPAVEPVKESEPPKEEPAPVVASTQYVDGNCESYRPLVQKYFGDATDAAMTVMLHESSCTSWKISETNDYGLFQLNGLDIRDPEANIKYAYEHKFLTPRRGTRPNFSAWYAVCTPDLVPKYAGIWCS